MAQTATNGHGPGARRIGPGSCVEPGPVAHVARPAPWAHEPGQLPPLVPVRERTGINGITRAEPMPCFLLVSLGHKLISSIN